MRHPSLITVRMFVIFRTRSPAGSLNRDTIRSIFPSLAESISSKRLKISFYEMDENDSLSKNEFPTFRLIGFEVWQNNLAVLRKFSR